MSYKIIFDKETYRRIRGFTKLAHGEIGGMAKVEAISRNKLKVYDLHLFEGQRVTSGSVNLDHDKLKNFILKVDEPEKFKFLWHSHGNMGTFFSSTDEECIDELLKNGAEYLISCVSSKNGNMTFRIDVKTSIGFLTIQNNIEYEIEENYEDLKGELDSVIVKEPSRIYPIGEYNLLKELDNWRIGYSQTGFMWNDKKKDEKDYIEKTDLEGICTECRTRLEGKELFDYDNEKDTVIIQSYCLVCQKEVYSVYKLKFGYHLTIEDSDNSIE